MTKLSAVVVLLASSLAVVFTYPSKLPCDREIAPSLGNTIMGATIDPKDDRMIVELGGVPCGGTLETNRRYTVDADVPDGHKFVVEVTGVTAVFDSPLAADCTHRRGSDQAAEVTSPYWQSWVTFIEAGDATLRVVSAGGHGVDVGSSEDCTFTVTQSDCGGGWSDGEFCFMEQTDPDNAESFMTNQECQDACAAENMTMACPSSMQGYQQMMLVFNRDDEADIWLNYADDANSTECMTTNNWADNDPRCKLTVKRKGEECNTLKARCVCSTSTETCATADSILVDAEELAGCGVEDVSGDDDHDDHGDHEHGDGHDDGHDDGHGHDDDADPVEVVEVKFTLLDVTLPVPSEVEDAVAKAMADEMGVAADKVTLEFAAVNRRRLLDVAATAKVETTKSKAAAVRATAAESGFAESVATAANAELPEAQQISISSVEVTVPATGGEDSGGSALAVRLAAVCVAAASAVTLLAL